MALAGIQADTHSATEQPGTPSTRQSLVVKPMAALPLPLPLAFLNTLRDIPTAGKVFDYFKVRSFSHRETVLGHPC